MEEISMKKRLLTLALVLVLALSLLTACGGNDNNSTPSGNSGGNSTTTPPASNNGGTTSTPNNNDGDTIQSGELYDITDEQIIAYEVSLADFTQTAIDGDARTEMIAAIPAEMKKGIGKLQSANIQENPATGEGYLLGFTFIKASVEDYRKLCEYYKSLGGTITTELADKQLKIDYDWGELFDCAYAIVLKDTITVSFTTK
jgi:hypothetical protein